MRVQRLQGARIRDNRNQVRLRRFRDMEPPTAEGMARRSDAVGRLRTQEHITAYPSTPELARRAAALV